MFIKEEMRKKEGWTKELRRNKTGRENLEEEKSWKRWIMLEKNIM